MDTEEQIADLHKKLKKLELKVDEKNMASSSVIEQILDAQTKLKSFLNVEDLIKSGYVNTQMMINQIAE